MYKRALVIGLDGATFSLLNPLVEQGQMPHLARLMAEGAYASLQSTLPYLSAPAWASFLTGMNPGKHGVFSFVEPAARVQTPYARDLPVVKSTSIQAPTLWQQLNAQGRRVGLLNVPITWPPQAIDGFMVSDSILTPGEESPYTYPAELKSELLEAVPDYRIRPYTFQGYSPQNIKEVTYYTSRQTEAALWLMERFAWDLFMVVVGGVDVLQHAFWRYLDPGSPAYCRPEAEKHRQLLVEFYHTVDQGIGRLVEHVSPETPVVLMSDHGFDSGKRIFYANRWLHELGLLAFEGSQGGWKARLMERGLTPELALRMLKRLDVLNLRQRWSSRTGLQARDRVRRAIRSVGPAIDWSRTRAYAGGVQEPFIHINLQGRQPMGIVAPGAEYEAVRDRLVRELVDLGDPGTGERIFGEVHRREELYAGPYLEQAPDLIYDFCKPGYISSDATGVAYIFDDEPHHGRGFHHRDGIFVAHGPDIKPEVSLESANIVDLAPTLLYLLGLEVPKDLDGRVLLDIFEPSFQESHPVRYTQPVILGGALSTGDASYASDELEEVHTHLKGLGYL